MTEYGNMKWLLKLVDPPRLFGILVSGLIMQLDMLMNIRFLRSECSAYILAWICIIRFCLTEYGYTLLVPHVGGPPSVYSLMVCGLIRQLIMLMNIRFLLVVCGAPERCR